MQAPGKITAGFELLRRYFHSGWAFLVPYLLLYLIYAGLDLPVNGPASLLHLYRALHCVHLGLGAAVLYRSWTSGAAADGQGWRLVPWLLLGLLFWLPGVYLEYPADPWAHYARINEWRSLDHVLQHSAWTKSSYFTAYSFVGEINQPLAQLRWFDLYYTGSCLLLGWQYFRLGRAAGLDSRLAFLFVVVHAFIAGNNAFGFFRYYGMSSSLFAQLGAVALIRITLESLQPRPGPPLAGGFGRAASLPVSAALLLVLVAFNHVQGLGITTLGVVAILGWRLVAWRRTCAWWLAAGTVLASAATVWWYPYPAVLREVYQPNGWMTAWLGFDLFSPSSPAFERAAVILGLPGLLNLAAGLFLLRRNHPAAWLTLVPVAALALPVFAIPLASALAARATPEIITFHRMLFAIPAGLALVVAGAQILGRHNAAIEPPTRTTALARSWLPWAVITALVVIPAGWPGLNRFYHALMRPPADLAMRHALARAESLGSKAPIPTTLVLPGLTFSRKPFDQTGAAQGFYLMGYGYGSGVPVMEMIDFAQNRPPALTEFPEALLLYTPASAMGRLSKHWLTQRVAFEYRGGTEFPAEAEKRGFHPQAIDGGAVYTWGLDWSGPPPASRAP